MKEREKLFVAQAFLNAVGSMCDTKDPDSLRGRVSEEYVRMYEETGAKTFDAKLDGEKVGTFSVKVSKPTDSRERDEFVVADPDKFRRWKDFRAVAYNFAVEHMQDVADWAFGMTGELPDGCEMRKVIVAGKPGGEVVGTTLRIDEGKVAEVMGAHLPEAAMLLLEGGKDEAGIS